VRPCEQESAVTELRELDARLRRKMPNEELRRPNLPKRNFSAWMRQTAAETTAA